MPRRQGEANPDAGSSKATWDARATKLFIDVCLEQVALEERNGTSFTKRGWRGIAEKFNAVTNRNYGKAQFKNKWDTLRKEWQTYWRLFANETGVGWDAEKQTFVADDEWWDRKQLENPLYARYRDKGLPHFNELTTLFKDGAATGEHVWVPSSGRLPSESDPDEDVYRPSMGSVYGSMEEGSGDSGDSEEDLSPGATQGLRSMNIDTSQGTSGQRSGEKRKRAFEVDRRGKSKVPAQTQMARDFSRFVDTQESRFQASLERQPHVPGSSLAEVMEEMSRMPEIFDDLSFHTACVDLMQDKSMRETFTLMKGSKPHLLHWLHKHTR